MTCSVTAESLSKLVENAACLDPFFEKIQKATKLSCLVLAALSLVRALAVMILESELSRRARQMTAPWPNCPTCGAKLESKGFQHRSMLTLAGLIGWKRRVGRCPTKGCKGQQSVPFDRELGIEPYQQTSSELKRVSCALSVFVTFEVAAQLLKMISGVGASPASIRNWVQEAGQRAMERLDHQLDKPAQGEEPAEESLESAVAALPLIMGADGVFVPFRPNGGSPEGNTVWLEVKVGIFARLFKRINKKGKEVNRLANRRLVAVLGCKDRFGVRMLLEGLRQGIGTAKRVVWISDGGKGFWAVYREHFARYAVGILDFYHAAQHLWKAGQACLGGATEEAKAWFAEARHFLRHGDPGDVLGDIARASKMKKLCESDRAAFRGLYDYLKNHRKHIDYAKFKELGLPIGSGMVESACKWLIQQRFKGTGMRWSEDGFNHLLHLRLAWVNSTFDDLFACSPNP